MWELAPESTSHAGELEPWLTPVPASQSLHPVGLELDDLDRFFATHFMPSGVLNQSGQLVRI